MIELLKGINKYTNEIFPKQKELFNDLTKGQKPHTLLITCSDSRIEPSLITQTEPGEIFVIRNAGNIVPPFGVSQGGGEEATIEFAINGLKIRNIVICGHSQCGAMTALVNNEGLEQMPSVRSWLRFAEVTKRNLEHLKEKSDVNLYIEKNALLQIQNLKTHPAVSAAIARGELNIFAWNYNLNQGTISVYNKLLNKYILSNEIDIRSGDKLSPYCL